MSPDSIKPSYAYESIVRHPVWVKLQSSHFYKSLYVLLEFDIMNPIFGKIIELVTITDTLIICVLHYYGELFCPHYNTFIIHSKGVISAIDVYSLADHRPFYAHFSSSSSDESLYILPYYLWINFFTFHPLITFCKFHYVVY